MENASRSIHRSRSSASISNKVFGGSGFASKITYNDFYGSTPNFGTVAFSPSEEDYAEIFGSFRSFRSSPIPVLDLPVVPEADVLFDFRSFNYCDVFGGSKGFDFAVSYEELFKPSARGGDNDSSDEVWTPDVSELSEVSESHVYDTSPEKVLRDDFHPSIDMFPSSCNPEGECQLYKENFSNLQTHVSHLQSLSGIPLVGNQTRVLQNTYQHRNMPKSTDDPNTCIGFINCCNNGNYMGHSYPRTHPKTKLQDVYELCHGTGDSVVPLQSFLLPALVGSGHKETSDPSSPHGVYGNYIPEMIPDGSILLDDTGENASLFPTVSVTSIKEVMEKAQAKLRNAKRIMEMRKEILQNCMRLELDTNTKCTKEEKPEFCGPGNLPGIKMPDNCEIKGNEFISFPPEEYKKSVIRLGNDISEKVGNFNIFEFTVDKNAGESIPLKEFQCHERVSGPLEEREICNYEEKNVLGNVLDKFYSGNHFALTMNNHKYEPKMFVEEHKMSEGDDNSENSTTLHIERAESSSEEEKVVSETWTRKNNHLELKIEKTKSMTNDAFKGILRTSETQEDEKKDRAFKRFQSGGGKQVPSILNHENNNQLVGFTFRKNEKLQKNGDTQRVYKHNVGEVIEDDRTEDTKNIEDVHHVHCNNSVGEMDESWAVTVKDEESTTEEVFGLGENPECNKYVSHGLLHHEPFFGKVQLNDTEIIYGKVKMYKSGICFLHSCENEVRLDVDRDNITDEKYHEEIGKNVLETEKPKGYEEKNGGPGVPLGTHDDDGVKGDADLDSTLTRSTVLGKGKSSRALSISRAEIFVHGSHTHLPHNENREKSAVFQLVSGGNLDSGKENGKTPNTNLLLNMEITECLQMQRNKDKEKIVEQVTNSYQNIGINGNYHNLVVGDNDDGCKNVIKGVESGNRREMEEMEREKEHKKDMIDVEITCKYLEKHEQEPDRVNAEYLESMKIGEKMEKLLPAEAQNMVEFQAVERVKSEAQEWCSERKISDKSAFDAQAKLEIASTMKVYESRVDGTGSAISFNGIGYSSGFRHQNVSHQAADGSESSRRCKARLERQQRTAERVGKALEDKNMRDLIVQQENAERCRLAEVLDADVKRWSNGKEGNLRALLSTLQYVLGCESGWKAVALTDVITSVGVKRAYRKATLCVHPDKLQQRGASIHDKYVSEKVFHLLKEAWKRFNSE